MSASISPSPGVSVRISTLILVAIFLFFTALLLAFQDTLPAAHEDRSIQYFSSDAGVYFEQYHFLSDQSIVERPLLLLNGTPTVLMMLLDGNLMLILAANLALMWVTLKVGMDCFASFRSRVAFLFGTLVFPYFLFGFLSLNKELYAMCAAIFFASHWLRGRSAHLWAALVLAFAARYYMLLAIVFLAFVFPRERKPRYWLAFAALVSISIIAPFAKSRIPGYSSANVLDGAGVTSILFSRIIDSYGYALIYPIKYLALVPTRLYSLAIGLGRPADPMEAMVSFVTVILLALAAFVLFCQHRLTPRPTRLIMMGLLSPIPIMWTEIGHWRYFSYVYFFLLFAVILHFAERSRPGRPETPSAGFV